MSLLPSPIVIKTTRAVWYASEELDLIVNMLGSSYA